MTSERPSRGRPSSGPPSADGVLEVTPTLVVGACGPVHMTWYRGPLSVALLEAADLHHQRLIRAYGRTAVFGMLESGISVPPSDVRARSAELIAQNGAHVAAASLVLPGDGFWVSAARSVITAAFLVARHPYPSKCFGSIPEAATYAVESLGTRGVSPEAVTRVAEAMRTAP